MKLNSFYNKIRVKHINTWILDTNYNKCVRLIVSYRSNYLSNYKKLSNNNHKVIDKLYEII